MSEARAMSTHRWKRKIVVDFAMKTRSLIRMKNRKLMMKTKLKTQKKRNLKWMESRRPMTILKLGESYKWVRSPNFNTERTQAQKQSQKNLIQTRYFLQIWSTYTLPAYSSHIIS